MSIVRRNAWSPITKVGGRVIGSVLGLLDQYYTGGSVIGGITGGYSLGGTVADSIVSPDTETKKITALRLAGAQDFYNEGKIKDRTVELGTNTNILTSATDKVFGVIDPVVNTIGSLGLNQLDIKGKGTTKPAKPASKGIDGVNSFPGEEVSVNPDYVKALDNIIPGRVDNPKPIDILNPDFGKYNIVPEKIDFGSTEKEKKTGWQKFKEKGKSSANGGVLGTVLNLAGADLSTNQNYKEVRDANVDFAKSIDEYLRNQSQVTKPVQESLDKESKKSLFDAPDLSTITTLFNNQFNFKTF